LGTMDASFLRSVLSPRRCRGWTNVRPESLFYLRGEEQLQLQDLSH
jgi:hypothetical protein